METVENAVSGTILAFQDHAWIFEVVEKYAVFTGLKVTVDGRECAREPFVSELRCRTQSSVAGSKCGSKRN